MIFFFVYNWISIQQFVLSPIQPHLAARPLAVVLQFMVEYISLFRGKVYI